MPLQSFAKIGAKCATAKERAWVSSQITVVEEAFTPVESAVWLPLVDKSNYLNKCLDGIRLQFEVDPPEGPGLVDLVATDHHPDGIIGADLISPDDDDQPCEAPPLRGANRPMGGEELVSPPPAEIPEDSVLRVNIDEEQPAARRAVLLMPDDVPGVYQFGYPSSPPPLENRPDFPKTKRSNRVPWIHPTIWNSAMTDSKKLCEINKYREEKACNHGRDAGAEWTHGRRPLMMKSMSIPKIT